MLQNQPAVKLTQAERRERVAEFARAGVKSLRKISEGLARQQIDIAPSGVKYILDKLYQNAEGRTQQAVNEAFALDLERLDDMIRAIYPAALKGDPKAVDTMVKILKRRAEMLGYDAPLRSEVSGPHGEPLKIIEEIVTVAPEGVAA